MRVDVYQNLRNGLWSMRAREGERRGRVVGYSDRLALRDCVLFVSERRRQAALTRPQRAVHAWVTGTVVDHFVPPPPDAIEFSYNPYKGPTFYRRDTGAAISLARMCWFVGHKAFAVI